LLVDLLFYLGLIGLLLLILKWLVIPLRCHFLKLIIWLLV